MWWWWWSWYQGVVLAVMWSWCLLLLQKIVIILKETFSVAMHLCLSPSSPTPSTFLSLSPGCSEIPPPPVLCFLEMCHSLLSLTMSSAFVVLVPLCLQLIDSSSATVQHEFICHSRVLSFVCLVRKAVPLLASGQFPWLHHFYWLPLAWLLGLLWTLNLNSCLLWSSLLFG